MAKDKNEADAAYQEARSRVLERFVLSFVDETFYDPLQDYIDGSGKFAHLATDALVGLRSTADTASLPSELLFQAVVNRHLQSLRTAENIRELTSVSPNESLSDDQRRIAAERAVKIFDEFVEQPENVKDLAAELVFELDHCLNSPNLSTAAQELLSQTVISAWSVFEHFARCFIIEWCDQHPPATLALFQDPQLKKFFGNPSLNLHILSDHDFDLSTSMGRFLFRDKRLENLGVIRACIRSFFAEGSVHSALGDELWLLNQRRHLLVHRRGIIDEQYLEKTSDQGVSGESLAITSKYAENSLRVVRDAVVAVLDASSTQSPDDNCL